MSPTLQILLGLLATIAAIASAVAAWKSFITSQSALDFQKKLSKSQDDLFVTRLTLTNLRRLKRIIASPLAASDEDFSSTEQLYLEIKKDLEHLSENSALPPRGVSFFAASSLAEVIDDRGVATEEIDVEIKRIETKINGLFD